MYLANGRGDVILLHVQDAEIEVGCKHTNTHAHTHAHTWSHRVACISLRLMRGAWLPTTAVLPVHIVPCLIWWRLTEIPHGLSQAHLPVEYQASSVAEAMEKLITTLSHPSVRFQVVAKTHHQPVADCIVAFVSSVR